MNPEIMRRTDEAEASITQDSEESADLVIARKTASDTAQTAAMHNIKEMALRAGRIQASKLIAGFSECLTVGQLRELKDHAQQAGVTFAEACQLIGISRQTAYRYLKAADELGDDFVSHVRQMGISVRILESARALPAEIRKRLTTGEVIDLEEVTKEDLTEVIKDLAQEHGKELASKDEALTKESKAREKAEAKAKETQQRLEATAQELANLKAGLPEDDEEAMQIIRDIEAKILPHLAVIMLTKMRGRSPKAVARITASLKLIEGQAKWAHDRLADMADGVEIDDEALGEDARYWADEIARGGERRPTI